MPWCSNQQVRPSLHAILLWLPVKKSIVYLSSHKEFFWVWGNEMYKINDSKVHNSLSSVCFEYVLLYFIQDWLVELEPQVQTLLSLEALLGEIDMPWHVLISALCTVFLSLQCLSSLCFLFPAWHEFWMTQTSTFCIFSEIILSKHDSLWCVIHHSCPSSYHHPDPHPSSKHTCRG